MRGMEQIEPGVFQNPRNHLEVYTTVAYRVRKFRLEKPGWRVDFQILDYGVPPRNEADAKDWRPRFILMRCEIRDELGNVASVGHAEEDRKHGPVNRTNAIENAETSALGRALANLGYCTGNYASADEVTIARERGASMDRSEHQRPEGVVEQKQPPAVAHSKNVPEVQPSGGGDESPFSPQFVELLAQAQSISNEQEFHEVWKIVQSSRDELSPTELGHLKPIILSARATYTQGGAA
tara:strand:+ start:1727 stop:2440 length:714 start_codon:yes stop_codon:yes gene_type:complete